MLRNKPSALKREHPAIQNLKFINFFLFLCVIFALLDPVSESGSETLILSLCINELQLIVKPY
jgi:hypothetical protein